MSSQSPLNRKIADRLREAADLLEQQAANPFRIGAYRRGADTIAGLDRDVGTILETEGLDGLEALPHVGRGIAAAVAEIVRTGGWTQLARLRGAVEPETLFQAMPGIGPALARRIHDRLDVDTLEGLEMAAHDGRLEHVPGIGHRRAMAVRATLESMLGRVRAARPQPADGPPVDVLLAVDAEYRDKAAAGALPTIAPRRFNPDGSAWLPILHTERGGWHFTALYSNTARAHELGRTGDWVVLYFYDDHHQEGQHTVVTETRGPLAGRRVVRGREGECREYYYGRGEG